MSDCGCHIEAKNKQQRKTLRVLLLINLVMFVVESITGVVAQSTALIADSLDMLADAIVYAISLYVVGRSYLHKARAASLSGVFQITLAFLVLFDVVRKYWLGSLPESWLMGGIGLIALIANIYCLWLISKHRNEEVHMRASWIFSKNDVIANISVIVAGILVSIFNSGIPDLVVGFGIAALVLWGGIKIIQESRSFKEENS
ncbi:MAG: cation transporter [Gloeocapsa sp. DLM2.Bin57]|nr:MAG: cation transporter [Gloeocapsa sp. DLM2.Bin57]